MNPTLKRFNHPAGLVRELEHWVVLIRLLGTAAVPRSHGPLAS